MLGQPERDELTASLGRLRIVALLADEFDPMSESEISEIEQAVGTALPADYRWFLGTFGASTTHGSWQIVRDDERFEVRSFFGRQVKTVPSLMLSLGHVEDLLEDAELPIADDLEGDRITLNARTGEVGFISTHDPSMRARGLATSFTDLVNKLEPYVYDD